MNTQKKSSRDPRPGDVYTSERGDPIKRAAKQEKKRWSSQKWRDWLDEDDVVEEGSEESADARSKEER